jgi:tetratricopeptide (TPR) repeat protein
LYYQGISKSEADKLLELMAKIQFDKKKSKSQVTKSDTGYLLKLTADKKFEDDDSYLAFLSAAGDYVSKNVFAGHPVTVEICTDKLETKKAVESFEALKKRDLDLADLGQADVAYAMAGPEEEILSLKKSLEQRPDSAMLLNELAYTLALEGKYSEALGYSKRSLELDPRNGAALDTMGYILVGQKHYGDATKVYRQALEYCKKEDAANVYLGLAKIQRESGDLEGAAVQEQMAAKIDPKLYLDWKEDTGE